MVGPTQLFRVTDWPIPPQQVFPGRHDTVLVNWLVGLFGDVGRVERVLAVRVHLLLTRSASARELAHCSEFGVRFLQDVHISVKRPTGQTSSNHFQLIRLFDSHGTLSIDLAVISSQTQPQHYGLQAASTPYSRVPALSPNIFAMKFAITMVDLRCHPSLSTKQSV